MGASKPKPSDFLGAGRETNDVNVMADLSDDDFDAVITEAKAEGNLSRANVARKAREQSGRSPAPAAAAAGSTERAHQEAELINAFRQTVRPLLSPKNVAGLSPKARTLLIDLFENAIQALKEEDR
jgi:hypothetical protein